MFLVQGYKSFPFYNLVWTYTSSLDICPLEREILGEELCKEVVDIDKAINHEANCFKYSVLQPEFLEKTLSLLTDSYYYDLLKEAYYDYKGEWKGYQHKDHRLYFELCLAQIWGVLDWKEKLSFPLELVIKYKLK